MNAALVLDEASVERAARAVMAAAMCDVQVEDADCAHVDDSMPCRCRTRFAFCVEHDWEAPQDPSMTICPWAARIARAALTAAPGDAETGRSGVIDAIEARAKAAAPGPWQFQPWGPQNQNGDHAESVLFDGRGETLVYGLPDCDGEFIAHARQDVPYLLKRLDEAGTSAHMADEAIHEWRLRAERTAAERDRAVTALQGIAALDGPFTGENSAAEYMALVRHILNREGMRLGGDA